MNMELYKNLKRICEKTVNCIYLLKLFTISSQRESIIKNDSA